MKNKPASHQSQAHRRSRRHAHPTQLPPSIDHNPQPDGHMPPDTEIPCWLPTLANPLGMPQNVLESLTRIIVPAYRAFVLEAPGELERTIGNSVVYLTWLELVNQIRLANALADPNSPITILHDPDKLTNRCLQLIAAKCQAAGLMFKVRLATEALNRMATPPVRQAFQPDSPSPNAPKSEIQQSVDQLNRSVRQPFQPDQSPVPLPPFDIIDHFATDSIPPRVADPVQSLLSDTRPVVPPQSESENAGCIDQPKSRPWGRLPTCPDSSLPADPMKLEDERSVDQLRSSRAEDQSNRVTDRTGDHRP